ncbi:MAG: alcohol dehydrogenase, partial [Planctomycetota bacterium]
MSSSTVDENAFRSPETNPTSKETVPKGIRIAIPIILLCLMIIARFIPSFWENGPSMTWAIGAFGPMLSCLLAVLWWFLLSGASWKEKGSGFGLLVLCLVVCSLLLHPSLAGLSVVITIPLGIAGFTLGLVVMSKSDTFRRLAVASLCCLIFAGPTIMLRNKGAWGNFSFDLEPRWVPSAEEQFLASRKEKSNAESEQIAELGPSEAFPDAEWPGFRGPNRDGVQRGVVFDVDWKANPPKEVWRIKVGPAWSSFAVAGNYLFTQEQRGPEEAIVCYAADSGSELWSSTVESR